MKKTVVVFIFVLLASLVGNAFFLTQDVYEGTYVCIGKNGTSVLTFGKNTFSRELFEKDGHLSDSEYGFYTSSSPKFGYDINYIIPNHGTMVNLGAENHSIFVLSELNSWYYICYEAILLQIAWLVSDIILIVKIIKRLPKIKIIVEKKNEAQP